jgi:hypothetical protein
MKNAVDGAESNWFMQHILKNPGVADGKLPKLLDDEAILKDICC